MAHTVMPPIAPLVLWVAAACSFMAAPTAQCALQWLPGDGVPGVGAKANAVINWDPDGPGPAPAVVAIGGEFLTAGTIFANHVALWHPTTTGTFSNLGAGVNGKVNAFAVAANGLVAGGSFTLAGGMPASNIARWDGTTWTPLGTGLNGEVRALLALPNGDLIAGGTFAAAGSVATLRIARWDGTTWSAMGTGLHHAVPFFDGVFALALLGNGDVVAGGTFSSAGSVPTSLVAKWDGSSWSALGTGLPASSLVDAVLALAVHSNGTVYAGGRFGGGYEFLWSWNGTAWSAAASLYGGFNNVQVASLATLANGNLVAGGAFSLINGVAASHLAAWNGSTWSGLGTGLSSLSAGSFAPVVMALAELPTGDLVAGGSFTIAGGSGAARVARWTGASWAPLANGIYDTIAAIATLPHGDLVVGGTFLTAGGAPAQRIARWNGTWSSLGTGMNGAVHALEVLPNGDLVAGGAFTTAGGASASRIARWDGTTWAPLGSGTFGIVSDLLLMSNGDLVVGGNFTSIGGAAANGIARWNGTTWSGFGVGIGPGSSVYSLAELPNGDLVAGGSFATAGGVAASNIARWNGTWVPLGSGIDGSVRTLAALPNGDLVAGGWFTTAGGTSVNNVARWDGSTWSALAGGLTGGTGFTGCGSLLVLPNGDLAAGGSYSLAQGTIINSVWRWDGASWSTMGTGVDGTVAAMRMTATGQLAIGGAFTRAGGNVTGALARLASTCPASASPFGAGCGSAGPNTLTAVTLPWLGSTYRAVAAGLAPNSLAVGVHGMGQLSLPLVNLLPTALPGCSLFVSPDVLALLIPTGPTVSDQLVVPSTSALVGQGFRHQVVPLAFDVSGSITEVTSTNALSLTIGAF